MSVSILYVCFQAKAVSITDNSDMATGQMAVTSTVPV